MPQHLHIASGDDIVGIITAINLGGTRYGVLLKNTHGRLVDLIEVDSGVERQPQDAEAQQEDFKNDFTHVRRGIAAASVAASHFRQRLIEQGVTETVARDIKTQLWTDDFGRGIIDISLVAEGRAKVRLVVGTGPDRVPGASPREPRKFEPIDTSIPLGGSHLTRALAVLENVGHDLAALSVRWKP